MGDKETVAQMKEKYGEITMLDFPEFTKKMFPGVYQMDIYSGLFGDMDDPSQFVKGGIDTFWGKPFRSLSLTLRALLVRNGWRGWPASW